MRLGLVSDSELYRLCRCGAARFYETWGVYETQFSWEPDENSRQAALDAEKARMASIDIGEITSKLVRTWGKD